MKSSRILNLISIAAFGLIVLVAGSVETSAQSRRDIQRERQRQQERYDRQRYNDRYRERNTRLPNRTVNTLLLQGYENGLRAGRMDRSRGKFNASNVYRNTPSRPYNGDSSSADYLYRQGYLEGYEDGYRGRIKY